MTYPDIRLVDSPSASATTLLDFNDTTATPWREVKDDFTVQPAGPEGDSDAIDPLYGDSQVSFTFSIKGTKPQVASLMSTLARRLRAGPGWLRYQTTATADVNYFRILRAEPGSVSMENVQTTSTTKQEWWSVGISLPCEDLAYGERVTETMIVVDNDPSSGTNRCFAVLPTIIGDAPAPARIRIRYTNAQTGRRHMLATTTVPAAVTGPVVWPVGGTDGWTVGTDTGASVANAAYSGGSYRAVSFATFAPMATRLEGNAPTTVLPGRYKVMARLARSDASSTFAVRFGSTTGFALLYGDTVALTWNTSATGHAAWVDMGEFTFPQGSPLTDFTGEPALTPYVAFQAQRLSGSGSLHLDSFLIVPVGSEYSRVMFVDYPILAPAAVFHDEYHDADLGVVYSRDNTTGALTSMDYPVIEGAYPVVVPGQKNVVHFVEQTSTTRAKTSDGATDVPDRIGTDAQIVLSYHPRWLYFGDS